MSKAHSKWLFKSSLTQFDQALASNYAMEIEPQVKFSQIPKVEIYDANTINSLVWPDTTESIEAKKFLLPLIKNGTSQYINNVTTELKVLKIDNTIIPITINFTEYDNSYVCSPYSYYITYAKHSIQHFSSEILKSLIKGGLWGLSKFFKSTKINQVVIVNNWLCSTNLFPSFDSTLIPTITTFLKQTYPQHTLIFRSVNEKIYPNYFQELKDNSYKMSASRQIFFTNTKDEKIFESRLFKSDTKLLQASGYEIIDGTQLSQQDIPRLLDLYNQVFIDKHSSLNPQLSANYIQLALDPQILQIRALRKNGQIDGVVGFTCRNGIMTCSLFGYDKVIPSQVALYRLLSTLLMLEAKERDLIFHQSAGASTYKKIRKAQDCIEYIAIYDKHLSLKQRLPWLLLTKLCNTLGIYFMKKY